MEEFRFIDLEVHSAAENMSIDEAIMLSVKDERVLPTLRIYRWNPSAVSIGTFQGMHEEVDVTFCKENHVDVIRRITGGGAVYHDYEGEITYSIVIPRGHNLAIQDIAKSYELLCDGIVHAMSYFGLQAKFSPINDVLVNGKKISGNAQTRRHNCILQHGTILFDMDVEFMFSVLKVSLEKVSDKQIKDVKQRVTSLRAELGSDVKIEDLRLALIEGFSKGLDIELVPDSLTEDERDTAEELKQSKYQTEAWNFMR